MNWFFAAALLLVPAAVNGDRLSLDDRVIVHLFEWKWSDIAEECEEFLAPYGFGGVQISPPNENIIVTDQGPRPWWERYQPVSYNLTTRSGTEDELKDMLQRCNTAGIRVFADVVFNHMTGDSSSCLGTANSTCSTDILEYPNFSSTDFHTPQCDVDDYDNATNVRNCKLEGLHDLNQTAEHVRSEIVGFLNTLISYGVAGFRVDSAKHMWPSDLAVIFGELSDLSTEFGFDSDTQPLIYQEVIDMTVDAAKHMWPSDLAVVYGELNDLNTEFGFDLDTQALIYQEVTDMDGSEAVHYYDYTSFGLVTDFRFGNELGRCFQGNNPLHWLYNFGTKWNLLPGNESIVFIENHDTERDGGNYLNYKSHQEYKMAIAYMLAWGFSQPRILSSFDYSEYDQGPPHDDDYNILSPQPIVGNICSNGWNCQHRWRQIYNMVVFHNVVSGESVSNWWSNNNNQIAFSRGNKGFIAFNLETGVSFNQYLQTGLPEGTYCDVISGNFIYSPCTFSNCSATSTCTGKSFTVNNDGYAQIQIDTFSTASVEDDGVVALHIEAKL